MGWGCRVILGVSLVLSSPTQAACYEGLVYEFNNLPSIIGIPYFSNVKTVALTGKKSRLKDLIKSYDLEQDIVFVLYLNGHASVYFREQVFDWGGAYSVHAGGKAAFPSAMVRIRIGKEKLDALAANIAKKTYEKVLTRSCVHNELIYLQQNGIRIGGGIPLFATTLWDRIRRYGFVDSAGYAFFQDIYLFHDANDRNPHGTLNANLQRASLGFIPAVFADMGLHDGDLNQFIHGAFPAPLADKLVWVNATKPKVDPLSAAEIQEAIPHLTAWERRVEKRFPELTNATLSQGLEYFSMHRSEFTTELARHWLAGELGPKRGVR